MRESPDPDPEDDRRKLFALTAEGWAALRAEAARLARLAELSREREVLGGEGLA